MTKMNFKNAAAYILLHVCAVGREDYKSVHNITATKLRKLIPTVKTIIIEVE